MKAKAQYLKDSLDLLSSKGSQLVEFAIIIIPLIIILLGIIEFGYLLHKQQVLDNATREAARRGAIGVKSDEMISIVYDLVTFDLEIDDINIIVLDTEGNDINDADNRTSGYYLVVYIYVDKVNLITPLGLFVSNLTNIHLKSRSEFVIEGE